jgi:hypothetical protein
MAWLYLPLGLAVFALFLWLTSSIDVGGDRRRK